LEGKQRNKEFESLQDIQAWYKNMRGVLKSITGIEVDRFEGESSLVLVVLDEYYVHAHFCPETNAFKHAEFSPDTIISKDLVEYAVKYDNFPYLVREYRQRILMQKTLESHLQELARMYFVSTSQPDGTVRISVTNGFGLVIKIPAEYPSKSNKLFLDALLPESEAAKLIDLVTQKVRIYIYFFFLYTLMLFIHCIESNQLICSRVYTCDFCRKSHGTFK
jgi:hypothetical protein